MHLFDRPSLNPTTIDSFSEFFSAVMFSNDMFRSLKCWIELFISCVACFFFCLCADQDLYILLENTGNTKLICMAWHKWVENVSAPSRLSKRKNARKTMKKKKHLNAIAGHRGSPRDKTSRTNRYFEKGLLPLSCLSTSTSCVSSDEVLRPVKVICLYFLQFAQLVQNASQHGSQAQLAGIELILYFWD